MLNVGRCAFELYFRAVEVTSGCPYFYVIRFNGNSVIEVFNGLVGLAQRSICSCTKDIGGSIIKVLYHFIRNFQRLRLSILTDIKLDLSSDYRQRVWIQNFRLVQQLRSLIIITLLYLEQCKR